MAEVLKMHITTGGKNMMNRKPMNRGSGFKRPERKERKPMILTPIRQGVSFGQSATLPVETAKYPYVRSRKLLDNCNLIGCQFDGCGIADKSVVACHSNWGWGRGGHIKSDDNRVASGCWQHHAMLDAGSEWSEAEKRGQWHRAHVRTVQKLVILKLWPIDVKVPDLKYPENW